MQRKKISDQVVVVVGASKGIGRATALRLAQKGAKVVAAARSRKGLQSLADSIKLHQKGDVVAVVADVSKADDMQKVAETAIQHYGRIDTWVHASAITLWSTVMCTTEEEYSKIMDVNFLGFVRSVQASIPHLKKQGGSLVAVSSVEAIRSLPLMGAYAASKHAMEGLIDSLRVELMQQGADVSVTSVQPATINTPIFDQARNDYSHRKMIGVPPIYHPHVVAKSIEYAATHSGVRTLPVGSAGWLIIWMQSIFPSLMDLLLLLLWPLMFLSEAAPKKDNWDNPMDEPQFNQETGTYHVMTIPFSIYNIIRESFIFSIVDSFRSLVVTVASRICSVFTSTSK